MMMMRVFVVHHRVKNQIQNNNKNNNKNNNTRILSLPKATRRREHSRCSKTCSFCTNNQFENEKERRERENRFAYYYYILTKGMENFMKKWKISSQKVFFILSNSETLCRQTLFLGTFDKRERDLELNTNTDNTRKKKKNGFPPARVATKSPERRLRFERPLGVRTTRLREHG